MSLAFSALMVALTYLVSLPPRSSCKNERRETPHFQPSPGPLLSPNSSPRATPELEQALTRFPPLFAHAAKAIQRWKRDQRGRVRFGVEVSRRIALLFRWLKLILPSAHLISVLQERKARTHLHRHRLRLDLGSHPSPVLRRCLQVRNFWSLLVRFGSYRPGAALRTDRGQTQ